MLEIFIFSNIIFNVFLISLLVNIFSKNINTILFSKVKAIGSCVSQGDVTITIATISRRSGVAAVTAATIGVTV